MAMTLVSTVTVGSGGATDITFDNIPQTGKDLLVVASLRSGSSSAIVSLNGDTTNANYPRRTLSGDGSAVTSLSNAIRPVLIASTTSDTSNTFGNSQLYISNYTVAANKSMSQDGVRENNATDSQQQISAHTWNNTAAVTSVTITALTPSFTQHSTASLYIIS
jgi:hypothetical protein